MTLPAWWKPEYAYMRHVPWADVPRSQQDAEGWWLCRWCGKRIAQGGRKQAWCSRECKAEAMVRTGISTRHLVGQRDKSICARCGIDCKEIEQFMRRMARCDCRHRDCMSYGGNGQIICADWGPWSVSGTRSMWEADHITPVAEGGGCCGLDNYQTLCLKCHKEDTADLAGRRAEARKRDQGVPEQMELSA